MDKLQPRSDEVAPEHEHEPGCPAIDGFGCRCGERGGTMTQTEFKAMNDLTERLLATKLGPIWWDYHNAMINYWSAEDTSSERFKQLDVVLKARTKAFKEKMLEILDARQ